MKVDHILDIPIVDIPVVSRILIGITCAFLGGFQWFSFRNSMAKKLLQSSPVPFRDVATQKLVPGCHQTKIRQGPVPDRESNLHLCQSSMGFIWLYKGTYI